MFKKIDDFSYIVEKTGNMNTDVLIFADAKMLDLIKEDNAYKQIMNVAALPGISRRAMAMPDIHYGYGFPIGGVAAFDVDRGVISPGGIGYDINCGVRLMATDILSKDISDKKVEDLCLALYNNIPSGVGSSSNIKLSAGEVKRVLKKGSGWAIQNGFGTGSDKKFTEDKGCMPGARPESLSSRAIDRGKNQLGTLGSGNHFLEIQEVTDIYDEDTAELYGVKEGMLVVMIHTGSRGLGFQVCDDSLKMMRRAAGKYKIRLEDPQLTCAPFKSGEGRQYFSAMKCAANYAWANRQCIAHRVRETVKRKLSSKTKVKQIYDVCHNVGKLEEHGGEKLIVHRKGATRSFGPDREEIPEKYRSAGQPVLVPGTMGTFSYLMRGTNRAMEKSFGSTCHGAGRVWSRTRAKKAASGGEVIKRMKEKNIFVMAKSSKTAAEESPDAYKDVVRVVDICHRSGLSEKVARMKPRGVVKG
ncbi:MAG: RtcB family protein [Elusimicrobiota bacterium]